jgi:hypothetical protein
LFEEGHSGRRVVGVRDSRYLNWRYAKNPLYRTHAIVAEADGRLVGYALFVLQESVAHIVDVFVSGGRPVERDLLEALTDHARGLGLASISAVVLDGHPVVGTLCEAGFVRRPDSSQMFGYAREESPLRKLILSHASWLLSVGDRDV